MEKQESKVNPKLHFLACLLLETGATSGFYYFFLSEACGTSCPPVTDAAIAQLSNGMHTEGVTALPLLFSYTEACNTLGVFCTLKHTPVEWELYPEHDASQSPYCFLHGDS